MPVTISNGGALPQLNKTRKFLEMVVGKITGASAGLFNSAEPSLARTRSTTTQSTFPGRRGFRFRPQILEVGWHRQKPTQILWEARPVQRMRPRRAGDRKCRGGAKCSRQPALALGPGARATARSFARRTAYSSDCCAGAVT